MNRADRDQHDLLSPAVIERITRWAVTDGWSGRVTSGYDVAAVRAAADGSAGEFRTALSDLVGHDGPGSRASILQAMLWGNVDAADYALANNEGLRSLCRTAAQRAEGFDVAEIATANGLRLRVEDVGEAYETALLVEDTPGQGDVLASGTVAAPSAMEALRIAAERELALGGLDQNDLYLIEQQIDRLDRLIAPAPGATLKDTDMTENTVETGRIGPPQEMAEWIDLGWYQHVPESALTQYTPELYRQWQEHSSDKGVQDAVVDRIWNALDLFESAQRRGQTDAEASRGNWTVGRLEEAAREAATPLSAQEIEQVSTLGGADFDFWRDVIGDDLVVGGVA